MTPGKRYRLKSAELEAKAKEKESEPTLRAELEQLARSYLRLAEQADRNSQADEAPEPEPKAEGLNRHSPDDMPLEHQGAPDHVDNADGGKRGTEG